jgi:serine/threonine protein kinase
MNNCWQIKTSSSMQPTLQPVQIIKEVKMTKDDIDLSPADIIVDPKSHTTYRKGRLIGKGGFAKVYEVNKLCASQPEGETFADKIIDKEVFSRRSTSKDKVKREILLHKDLIHANVVRFYNFFSDGKIFK